MPTLRRRALLLAPAFMTMAAEADRTVSWLAAWDGQDIHRTATPGDAAGAASSRPRPARWGLPSRSRPSLNRLDPVAAFVELEGTRYPGRLPCSMRPTRRMGGCTRWSTCSARRGPGGAGQFSPLAVYSPDFATMPAAALGAGAGHQGGAPGLALSTRDPLAPTARRSCGYRCDTATSCSVPPARCCDAGGDRSTRTRTEATSVVVT